MNKGEKVEVGLAVLMAAIACAGLVYMANFALAQPTSLGPFQTTVSVPNTVVLNAVPANPSRRGFTICNSNATAANIITVGFGSNSPTDGVGLIIPGGQVQASCLTILGPPPTGGGMGAQMNMIGHVAGPTSVVVLEY
jgi:hypothetical protein